MYMYAMKALPPITTAVSYAKGCFHHIPCLQVGHWPDLKPARHPEPAAGALLHLLVPDFTMGRAQLTDSPSAFVDLGGRALAKTSMSSYLHSVLSRVDPSFPSIPPSLLTHVFVDDRRAGRGWRAK